MIDADGFRPNVGIVLSNASGKVFWAKRCGQQSWQFPQGGIESHESCRDALYRELYEEVGLQPGDVNVVAETRGGLRYRIPPRYLRRQGPRCIGQKQVWFLLRLMGGEHCIHLDRGNPPEFDGWRWVDYWAPLEQIVSFKRQVYRCALKELAGYHWATITPPPKSAG